MPTSSTPNVTHYNGFSGANATNIIGATTNTVAGFHGTGSTQAATITDATVAAGANPTKAEYDALVGKFNAVLLALEGKGILASA